MARKRVAAHRAEANSDGDVLPLRRSRTATEAEMLRPVLEMAVAVARQGEDSTPKIPAPAGIRPFLSFSRLPTKSLEAARRAIEEDEKFRSRVADRFRPGELDLGADSWLRRPDGWMRVYEDALDAAVAKTVEVDEIRAANDAQRRALRLEAHLAEVTGKLDAALSRVEDLEGVDARADRLAEDLARSEEANGGLQFEVRRAIKDLKDTERLLVDRVDEVKSLQAQNAELAAQNAELQAKNSGLQAENSGLATQRVSPPRDAENRPPSTPDDTAAALGADESSEGLRPGPVPAPASTQTPKTGGLVSVDSSNVSADEPTHAAVLSALADAVVDAAGAATTLGQRLEASAELLDSLARGWAPPELSPDAAPPERLTDDPAQLTDKAAAAAPSEGADGRDPTLSRVREERPPRTKSGPRSRRVPLRPRRGQLAGSPGAIEDMLLREGVIVLVDGYNASIGIWPQLELPNQREALLSAMERVHARTSAEVRIVYDGNERGGPTSVAVPLRVRVEFTPQGVEADDRIIDLAETLPPSRPVVVISGDRRVQSGVRRVGANVLTPQQLREYLSR